MHDIHVVVAKNYIESLKEEVKKGMREKAEQGMYPGRAPFGYCNNSLARSIEVHQEKAQIARRIFALYATGDHSLSSLRFAILGAFSVPDAEYGGERRIAEISTFELHDRRRKSHSRLQEAIRSDLPERQK